MQELTKDMIAEPQHWALSIAVHDSAADVAIDTLLQDNSLIYRHLPLDKTMEHVAAFEELIYENPLLLSDFKKADALLATKRFTIVPSEIKSEDALLEIGRALWPDPALELICNQLPTGDTLIMAIDRRLISFLRRTFLGINISHPISAMVKYFHQIDNHKKTARLHAILRDGGVDIVALSDSRLMIATSIEVTAPVDLAYYILAAADAAKMERGKDELLIGGHSEHKDEVMDMLRQYARYVMPMMVPPRVYKSGKEAIKAPFSLLIPLICES